MSTVFSRQAFRGAPGLTKALAASVVLSTVILLATQAKNGVYLNHMTDHFHHSRATWSFFVLGLDVYTQPYGDTCARLPYPQPGCPWPNHPVAYPPGMFLVFTPPALLGRFVPSLSTLEFGKIVIAYLTLITHAALWAIGLLARRVGSQAWMGLVAFVWIFAVRLSLLGFYDGAWLLTAALGVHAMIASRPARAVLWFAASALLSYRAASLVPLAAVAFVQMLRGSDSLRTKALVTTASALSGAVVVACFAALLRYGPRGEDGAHGVGFGFFAGFMLAAGLLVAIAVAYGSSLLVGACVALSSILGIVHGGHSWHGCVCVVPLLALSLASKRPLWAQVVLGLWFVFYLNLLFLYAPLAWLEELLRFAAAGGAL